MVSTKTYAAADSPDGDYMEAPLSGIEGGRAPQDLLARQSIAGDGFSAAEMSRMRRAYQRFIPPHASELDRAAIYQVLVHLSYLGPGNAIMKKEIEGVAQKISDFSTYNFQELVEVIERYAVMEHHHIQVTFKGFSDAHGCLSTKKLPRILRHLGMHPARSVILEILSQMPGHSGAEETTFGERHGSLTFEELIVFLAIYRAAEGCSRKEVAAAREVFCSCTLPVGRKAAGKSQLRPAKLSQALLQLYGRHYEPDSEHLFSQLQTDWQCSEPSDQEPQASGVDFPEFLIWARRLREARRERLRALFSTLARPDSAGGDGQAHVQKIARAMSRDPGWPRLTLSKMAVLEFLNTSGNSGQALDFDDFSTFLDACQQNFGFRASEVKELNNIFHRFAHGAGGEMEPLGLLDLLRYLGYGTQNASKETYRKDGRKTLDLHNFLRFMRTFREEELGRVQKRFDIRGVEVTVTSSGVSKDQIMLPLTQLRGLLADLGMLVEDELFERLFHEDCVEYLDFDAVAVAVEKYRTISAAERRRRAGFSVKELALARRLFDRHKKANFDVLVKGELLWLLMSLGVPVDTLAAREGIMEMLEQARAAAHKCGTAKEDVGEVNSPQTTFWALMHLLRALRRRGDGAAVEREEEAVASTGFSPTEVTEFREVFQEWSLGPAAPASPSVPKGGSPRRRSDPAIRAGTTFHRPRPAAPPSPGCGPSPGLHLASGGVRLEAESGWSCTKRLLLPSLALKAAEAKEEQKASCGDALAAEAAQMLLGTGRAKALRLSLSGLKALLTSLGLKLTAEQKTELELKALSFQHVMPGQRPSGELALEFSEFLRVMRWLVDVNFADINKTTASAVAPPAAETDAAESESHLW